MLQELVQKSLLLVLELEVQEEAWPFNQVISVVLSSAFDNLAVIFELVGLQNVPSDVVFERVIVY